LIVHEQRDVMTIMNENAGPAVLVEDVSFLHHLDNDAYYVFIFEFLSRMPGIMKRQDKIGIYSGNAQWWQMTAYAAWSIGCIVVPVYDSLGKGAADYIIDHSDIRFIAVSVLKFPALKGLLPSAPKVEKVLLMADTVPPGEERAGEAEVLSCQSVLETGEKSALKNEFAQPDDLAVIMYTSGSTGTPKGCMLQQAAIVASACGLGNCNYGLEAYVDTFISFLPLAHVATLTTEVMLLGGGARIGFARGPVSQLVDDIKALQPTLMLSVPRVLNRVAEAMQGQIAKKPKILQWVLGKVLKHKADCTVENRAHSLIADIITAQLRAVTGGKMRFAVTAGAPIRGEVWSFLNGVITPSIVNAYGLTESCAGVSVQEIPSRNRLSVGTVLVCCELKLRRVASMPQYDPTGDPPAGELMIRGPCVFCGYYKQEALTRESMSADGWFATGDVASVIDGELYIVDRVKQLVKLSQGEYLSLSGLTEIYSTTPGVSFIYVHADPSEDRAVAIVVPKPELIAAWQTRGITAPGESAEAKHEIVEALGKVWEREKLRGFERITHIILEPNEPTIENGLLTPSMKAQLNVFKQRYQKEIAALYAQIRAEAPRIA
jgi:long-chain acyl-CoA synthetase